MDSINQPRAAGEAAQIRLFAEHYVKEWGMPAGGYVVFFSGKPCGWMRDLWADRAENGRLTHRPGCVAVAMDGPPAVWDAVGGNYMGGAERWAPRAERVQAEGGAS